MFGLSPKLPVTDEDRLWVDEGFNRLEKLLGRRRMLEAKVILPTAEDFPDAYDASPAAAEKLLDRLCTYMKVDRHKLEFEIFPDEAEELRKNLSHWRGKSAGPAGVYCHGGSKVYNSEADEQPREDPVVAVLSTKLKDPLVLVATLAHELGHVILLGGGLMSPKASDHEPMTDLLTVYLGLGVFTANSAARFTQYQDERKQGWSMQRLGYLPEEVFGYALARFAVERGEEKSEWAKHLSTNVRAYYKRSRHWLARNPHPIMLARPIG